MLIAWGISEPLDQLKLTYHGLPDFLTALVQQELDRIPRELSNEQRRQLWSIVYMPQVPCHAGHVAGFGLQSLGGVSKVGTTGPANDRCMF